MGDIRDEAGNKSGSTATTTAAKKSSGSTKISALKGRPMLSWVGKRAPSEVKSFPAVRRETFTACGRGDENDFLQDPGRDGWPEGYPDGGLLFHGDNKEVLANLLTSGFRGKVKLVYIDPPFDSGADYVRKVRLRGVAGEATIEGEPYSLGEQVQYTDIWANDSYLQFMYERLIMLKELLAEDGSIWLHCDWHKSHLLRCLMDEVFGADALMNEVIWQRTDPHNDAKSRLGIVHDTLLWYSKGERARYNWREVVEPLSDAALKEYSLVELPDGKIIPYSPELNARSGRRFKLDDCTYKGNDPTRRFRWRGARPSDKRVWPYDLDGMEAALARGELYLRDSKKGAARCRKSYLDNREGQVLQTIWTAVGRMKGGVEYPTEKPHALLARIIQASTNVGDLVLDCFVGSGKSATAAQELGRRWIGADINKGAVQIASKRLQRIMDRQAKVWQEKAREELEARALPKQNGLSGMEETEQPEEAPGVPRPAQLSFSVYRVNDYELDMRHEEAVDLACEHIGAERNKVDPFFDGTLGKGSTQELVKVVPFDHPLGVLDVEEVRRELASGRRAEETRGVVLVALGKELAVDPWLEEFNKRRAVMELDEMQGTVRQVNKLRVVDLRTDGRYGEFIIHRPAEADIFVGRDPEDSGYAHVEIGDFISPTIAERLDIGTKDASVFEANIPDWRSMVDCVMIDTAYDGDVFNVGFSDVPEGRNDLVVGSYRLPVSEESTTVAVKIIDMLGEEVLQTQRV